MAHNILKANSKWPPIFLLMINLFDNFFKDQKMIHFLKLNSNCKFSKSNVIFIRFFLLYSQRALYFDSLFANEDNSMSNFLWNSYNDYLLMCWKWEIWFSGYNLSYWIFFVQRDHPKVISI